MSEQIQKVIETGKMLKEKGVRYKLGAKSLPPNIPLFLDCSGFVRYCFRAAGVKIPDGTYYQFNASKKIKEDELKAGDVGFLYSPSELGGRINHVGIYIGDGYWMHCNYSRNGITIERAKIFKHLRRFDMGVDIKTAQKERRNKIMVKVKLNGEVKEVNGFEEKNINYVSIRELAELLGKKVKYDERNQVVELE